MRKSNKKGFTVVELVIVIAIIAILAAVLIPTFAGLIQKANESKDTQLVKNLNTALAADNKEHKTMTSALEAAAAFGYDVGKINASATGNEILWDSKNDVFCYLKGGNVEYIPETNLKNGALAANETYKLWKIYTSEAKVTEDVNTGKTYSIYWNSSDAYTKDLKTGFDAGNCKANMTLKYVGGTSEQSVVIRTNSAMTTLTINDDTNSKIDHYDSLGTLVVTKCGYECYYEYGNTAYAKATEGKIVAKTGGTIRVLYADAAKVAAKEDGGSIGVAYCVSTAESEATEAGYTSFSNGKGGNVTFQYVDEDNSPLDSDKIEEIGTVSINEAKAPEIAKKLEENADAVVYNLNTGNYYGDLYTALGDVTTSDKTTIILLKNIIGASNKNYEIKAGQNIIFDLNGHTMNTVAPDGNAAYAIENKGMLTIKDNSDKLKNGTGTGKLEMNALNPDTQGIPGYASNLITNRGNLTIESGWLYNASSHGYAAYAIDSYSNGNNVSLVINGGKITTNVSSSIRQAIFTGTTNDVTINGGVIGSYWIQNYGNASTSANGSLVINDVEALYNFNFDLGYSLDYGYGIISSNVIVEINGGNFKGLSVRANDTSVTNFLNGGTFSAKVKLSGDVVYTINSGTFNDEIICEGTVTRNGGTYNALVRENYVTLKVYFGGDYITDAIVGEDYTIDTGDDLSGKVVSAKYYGDNPDEDIDSSKITIDGSKITIDKTALHKFTGKQFCIWIKVSDAE